MSVDTTMAVLYAQSGLSTNVANAAMVAPQASLAMTRMLAAEAMRQERTQVEKAEKAEQPGVNGEAGGNKGIFGTRRRKKGEILEEEEIPSQNAPFTGVLLNVRV